MYVLYYLSRILQKRVGASFMSQWPCGHERLEDDDHCIDCGYMPLFGKMKVLSWPTLEDESVPEDYECPEACNCKILQEHPQLVLKDEWHICPYEKVVAGDKNTLCSCCKACTESCELELMEWRET
jgi:hypothetical protein